MRYWLQIRRPVAWPAVSDRYGNGEIPLDQLVQVAPRFGAQGYLAPAPARAWKAMVAAAAAAGIELDTVGAYRPLAAQIAVFEDRYEPATPNIWLPGRKKHKGRWWAKKPKVATVATPGTSNHGKAAAIDVANASGARLTWLEEHASVYGWAWELRTEPWHVRYLLGDDVTAAVAEHERPIQPVEDDMPQPITTGAATGNGRVPFLELTASGGTVSIVGHNGARVVPPAGADMAEAFGRQIVTFPVEGRMLGWSLHGGRVVIATDTSATYTVEIAA